MRWWAHQDLNLEPTDYESAALTVELWARKKTSTLELPFLGKVEGRAKNTYIKRGVGLAGGGAERWSPRAAKAISQELEIRRQRHERLGRSERLHAPGSAHPSG